MDISLADTLINNEFINTTARFLGALLYKI